MDDGASGLCCVEPAGDLARGRVVLFVAGTGAPRQLAALAPRVGSGNSVVSGELFGKVPYGRGFLNVISTDEGLFIEGILI